MVVRNVFFFLNSAASSSQSTRIHFWLSIVILITAFLFKPSSAFSATFTCTWTGASGDWNDPGNWNGCASTPTNGAGNFYDVTMNSGTTNLTQGITVSKFTFTGGLFTGDQNFVAADLMTFSGGTLEGSGFLRAQGGLVMNGGFKEVRGNRRLIVTPAQLGVWTSGLLQLTDSGSTLETDTLGTFNLQFDNGVATGNGEFLNNGTVNLQLSASNQVMQFDTRVSNNGLLDAQTGILRLGKGGTSSGTFNGSANSLINFSGGVHDLLVNSVINAHQVKFSDEDLTSGITTISGNYTVNNTEITANTVSFESNAQTGTLIQSGGTLQGGGTLSATGLTQFSGGVMQGSGTTRADGGLNLFGGTKEIRSNRILVSGSGQAANWSQGDIVLADAGSTLLNESGSTFTISANNAFVTGSGKFANEGTVNVQLSASNSLINILSLFNNDGLVDVQKGRLRLGGGGDSTGTFQGSVDSLFHFSGGTHNLLAGSDISASEVRFSNADQIGTTNIYGTYSVTQTDILNNTVNFNSDVTTGALNQTGGVLGGSGIITLNGLTKFSNGTMQGTGTTLAQGGLELVGGSKTIKEFRTLANGDGQTANWTQGNIQLVDSGSTLLNEVNGTFNFSADNSQMTGLGKFENRGSTVVSLSDNSKQVTVATAIDNSGTLNIAEGQLIANGSLVNSGSVNIENGSNLTKNVSHFVQTSGNTVVNGNLLMLSGLDVDIQGGSLSGNGTIFGDVINNGQTSAGDGIGSLSIVGDYNQLGGLFVEIAGTSPTIDYDVLDVSGQASIGGTVEVDLRSLGGGNSPWQPIVGQTFDVLVASLIIDNNLVLGGPFGHYFNYSIVNIAAGDQALRLTAIPVAIPPSFQLFSAALLGLVSISRRKVQ